MSRRPFFKTRYLVRRRFVEVKVQNLFSNLARINLKNSRFARKLGNSQSLNSTVVATGYCILSVEYSLKYEALGLHEKKTDFVDYLCYVFRALTSLHRLTLFATVLVSPIPS